MRNTLDDTARQAIASACDDVGAGGEDDLVDRVVPALVARPTSTQQVSEVLRAAAAHDLTVVPRGRGTKLSWGLPPTSADVVLDVSGMDQVLDHQAGDLIVETQAGTRLSELQAVVGKEGQRLVLDETVPGASVGGTLATNASGPQRVLVGTARDLLIGVTVVRADGVVAKAGGRVVKNVAGYDLGKLVIGSFGTLAVVTEALFRLHPLPSVQRWVSLEVPDAATAHEVAQSVVHAQVVPGAVEVDWPAEGPGTVTVQLGGKAEGVEGRVATLRGLLGERSDRPRGRAGGLDVVPVGERGHRPQADDRALRAARRAGDRPRRRSGGPRLRGQRRAVRRGPLGGPRRGGRRPAARDVHAAPGLGRRGRRAARGEAGRGRVGTGGRRWT